MGTNLLGVLPFYITLIGGKKVNVGIKFVSFRCIDLQKAYSDQHVVAKLRKLNVLNLK